MLHYLFMVLMILSGVMMIVLVLIQRGKGGGLAGALGGMGGQSAFGTKAGDLFTRITIGLAAFWIVLCILAVRFLGGAIGGGPDTGAGATDEPTSTATSDQTGTGSPAPVGTDTPKSDK